MASGRIYTAAMAVAAFTTPLDLEKIVAMGAHPLVPFLARMQIERLRRG